MSQNKDSFYFSHDSNARNDIKIIKLRRQLGLEGYGIYWCLIEMLRETSHFRLSLDCIEDVAFQIGASREKIETVIKSYGLFKVEEPHFFSDRLVRSMQHFNAHKDRLSEAGKKGMKNRWENGTGSAPLKLL